jgi:hypothetical protein
MFGDIWKRSTWIRTVALPFTVALMRISWMYPYIRIATSPAFSGSQSVRLPAWLFFAFAFGSALLAHLASEYPEGYLVAILTGFVAGFTVLWIALPPEGMGLGGWFSAIIEQSLYWENTLPAPVVLLVATAIIWWRGLATHNMDYTDFVLSFSVGVIMMIVLLLISRALPPAFSSGTLVTAVLVFLISGLATLALSGALQALRQSANETGISLNLSRHWLLAVVSVLGAILLLGAVLGLLIAPESVKDALAWLRPLWRLLGQIVYYILYPIIYLLFLLLAPILDWFEGRYQPRPQETGPSPVPTETLEPVERVPTELPPALDYSLRGVVAVAAVAFFVMLFVKVLQQRGKSSARPEVTEDRERIWSWDLMKEQIGSLIDNARRNRPQPLFGPLMGTMDPRRVIREAYRRLIALAIDRGHPRAERDTPYTYQAKLETLVPGREGAIRTLTDAYVAARYDETPPSQTQAEAAQEALEDIEEALSASKPDNGSFSE